MARRDVIDTCPLGLFLLEHVILELIHHLVKPRPHEAAPAELLANSQHHPPPWTFQPSRSPGRLQPNHHHRGQKNFPFDQANHQIVRDNDMVVALSL